MDILGGGVCDYCNAAVDYRNFGWIITSYTNLGQPENPYAKILAAALGIYGIILAFSLVLMICSEDGKETLEIWQSIGRSSEYLKAVKQDIVYPDDVLEDLTECSSFLARSMVPLIPVSFLWCISMFIHGVRNSSLSSAPTRIRSPNASFSTNRILTLSSFLSISML